MRPTLADRSFTFASPAIQEQPGDSPCVCLGRHFNVFLMFFYYYFLFINYDLFSLRFLALKA